MTDKLDWQELLQWVLANPPQDEAQVREPSAGPAYGSKDAKPWKHFSENLGESFADALFRILVEKGLTGPEVYKPVNVKRQVMSRLNNGRNVTVDKKTACALAIGLHLKVREADDLLHKAGYHLSDSLLDDVIVKYFLANRKYDIHEINAMLFEQTGKILTN